MAELSDFTELITSEHAGATKFVATVGASVQAFVDQINVAENAYSYYDLDNAVGTQLDAVGLWVGASRLIKLPVNVYFSFDEDSVGFDQGIWWEVGDALNVVTSLDDDLYRLFIRAKILCNMWDGTLPAAIEILEIITDGTGVTISVVEGERSVAFTITGNVATVIKSIIQEGYLPLNPAGISVSYSFVS